MSPPPLLKFNVSFDDSLDTRTLALSGKSDTPQWLDTLQHKQPSDVAAEIELGNAIRMKYPGLCAMSFEIVAPVTL